MTSTVFHYWPQPVMKKVKSKWFRHRRPLGGSVNLKRRGKRWHCTPPPPPAPDEHRRNLLGCIPRGAAKTQNIRTRKRTCTQAGIPRCLSMRRWVGTEQVPTSRDMQRNTIKENRDIFPTRSSVQVLVSLG